MPLGTQARLLRVLENGEFIKVGSSKVQKTDVRVVAATNINLLQNVEQGKFREDLYYRLSTVPIYVPPLRDRGSDILLLFRKFASDFAEKYRVKPITLTDEAEQILLNYRFPGNIRQLKNLVEQMSVLATENKEINADTLRRFLPSPISPLPALYRGEGQDKGQSFSERDLLYKVLFDMKKDMTELKKFVLEAIQNDDAKHQIIKEHQDLFNDVDEEHGRSGAMAPVLLNLESTDEKEEYEEHDEDIQDISHETEDESLSLEKKERELIIRALKKNNNKRKYAAQDLGISERTLYRKIKQYELEDI